MVKLSNEKNLVVFIILTLQIVYPSLNEILILHTLYKMTKFINFKLRFISLSV